MDFRVTHFLVADSTATDGLQTGTAITALTSGRLAVVKPFDSDPTVSAANPSVAALSSSTPVQIVQGLDTTDPIQKELGLIKSGIIDPKKIISVRKMVGSNNYSRQVKVLGASVSAAAATDITQLVATSTTPVLGTIYFTATGIYQLVADNGSGAIAALPTPTSLTVADASSGTYTFAYYPLPSTSQAWASGDAAFSTSKVTFSSTYTVGDSLEVENNKDYSLSVRARSYRANTLSPFGLMRGYSVNASNTYVGPATTVTADKYLGFSVAFGLVKAFALDNQMEEFAKVHAVYTINASPDQSFIFTTSDSIDAYRGFIDNTQSGVAATVVNVNNYDTWHDAITTLSISVTTPANATYIAGTDYKLSFIVEALEQPMFTNASDLTLFPYKWDFVKLNAFFQEGPYHSKLAFTGTADVINAGVTTQTPITFDRTASGAVTSLTTSINLVHIPEAYSTVAASGKDVLTLPGYIVVQGSGANSYVFLSDIKLPNLTNTEVKYLAHEYQSYSLKYKQQFQGVKYNAMLMDPTQSKVNYNGLYTLYYVEYMPYGDFSYTSTMPITQLTVIAVPQNLTTTISNLDTVLALSGVQSPGNVTINPASSEVVW